MKELGTVLELLHDAPNRWTTIRATVRERRAVPPSETTARIWIGETGCVREERDVVPNGGEVLGSGDTLAVLFDPSRLIPSFDFDVLEMCTYRERAAIRVRAKPRETGPTPTELDPWADDHELIVDVERGVLLRVGAFTGGEEFAAVDVLEIAFDEVFADDIFLSPEGETARSLGEPPGRMLSLEDAVREAPFPVWAPSRVPRGFTAHVSLSAPGDRPATLVLHYVPDDAIHRLSIRETPTGELGEIAWSEPRTIEHEGEQYLVVTADDKRPWLPTHVFAEREGTSIEIQSDLELETLLGIAASLVLAHAEPPRL